MVKNSENYNSTVSAPTLAPPGRPGQRHAGGGNLAKTDSVG
jgi:hypothetical protein